MTFKTDPSDIESAQEGKADAVTAPIPVPAPRQSKVLDMVHNFQRLQVT